MEKFYKYRAAVIAWQRKNEYRALYGVNRGEAKMRRMVTERWKTDSYYEHAWLLAPTGQKHLLMPWIRCLLIGGG